MNTVDALINEVNEQELIDLAQRVASALATERKRAEKAEAERDEAQHLLVRCVNEGTDGFAGDDVSLEFLRNVPAECAGMKRQRDEALRNLSIAHSDGHHDGYRDGCLASLHDVKRIERETIERCAKVADEWATDEQRQFGNGGPGAAIRAMREGGDE